MKKTLKNIQQFKKQNPSFNWNNFSTWEETAYNSLIGNELHAKTKKYKSKNIALLKAYQRLYRLCGNHTHAETLMDAGYHSAIQIVQQSEAAFVKATASLFSANGLSSAERAKVIYREAMHKKSQAVLHYTNVLQQNEKHYKNARFANLSAEGTGLAQLPSYTSLFGDVAFCSCERCRSIFSPAAYFVDLMRFQAGQIEISDTDSPFQLEKRREDLMHIELSCENTNTEISKLEIVNEVLANTISKDHEMLLDDMAKANYPWSLPFNYPLQQIREVLDTHHTSLYTLWESLNPNTETTSNGYLESLNISPEQWEVFHTQKTGTELLENYGLEGDDVRLEQLNSVNTFLKQTGLKRAELDDLLTQDLSASEMSDDLEDKRNDFYINIKIEGDTFEAPMQIGVEIDSESQKELEVILNTTEARFDHINRFVRLTKALGWSFAELDWSLKTIADLLSAAEVLIDEDALPHLAWINLLVEKHGLSVYEAAASLGALKDTGLKNGPSFFEQVFLNSNVPKPPNWGDATFWIVPELGSKEKIDAVTHQIQSALSAALKISEDDLIVLANAVLSGPGKSEFTGRSFALSYKNLAVLYRLSLLPRLTGLDIAYLCNPALIASVKADFEKTLAISGLDVSKGLHALLSFAEWIKGTHFSAEHLQYVMTGKSRIPDLQNQVLGTTTIANFNLNLKTTIDQVLLSEPRFVDALKENRNGVIGTSEVTLLYGKLSDPIANKTYIDPVYGVVQELPEEKALAALIRSIHQIPIRLADFAGIVADDTSLWTKLKDGAFIEVTNETEQTAYIKERAFEADSQTLSTYLETVGYTAQQTTQIVTVFKKQQDIYVRPVQAVLSAYESSQQQSFAQQLAGLFGISYEYIPLFFSYTSLNLVMALQGAATEALRLLQRYVNLVQHLLISPAAFQHINKYPKYFGIADKSSLMHLHDIKNLVAFKHLILAFQDSQNYLIGYFDFVNPALLADGASAPSVQEASEHLAAITQWDAAQIELLIDKTGLNEQINKQPAYGTVEGLVTLKAYFDQAAQTGVDISSLLALNAIQKKDSEKNYVEIGNTLWSGLQQEFDEGILNGIKNTLNGLKRDALVPLVITELNRKHTQLTLETSRDLYEYLLLDVEVEGIVTTSRIGEAIAAVQLFIYRSLNHLNPTKPTINEDLLDWWPWMSHYRSWQENREVFLYPENYIEPQLRKVKTPQFAQLESDLQQANLTEESDVTQAFNTYMDGFVEVNNLDIIGSAANDTNDSEKVTRELCFIGKTKNSPYTYYYMLAFFVAKKDEAGVPGNFEPASWGHWKPIANHLNPVREVNPVYAFNNWYLFWVEQQQVESAEANESTYMAYIRYATLDFNQNWGATKTFRDLPYDPKKIHSDNAYASLRISMLHSIKQIAIVFITDSVNKEANTYWFSPTHQSYMPALTIPFAAAVFPAGATKKYAEKTPGIPEEIVSSYQSRAVFSVDHLYKNTEPTFKASFWFKANSFPEDEQLAPIMSSKDGNTISPVVSLNKDGMLSIAELGDYKQVTKGQWNHLYIDFDEVKVDQSIDLGDITKKFAPIEVAGSYYAFESIRFHTKDGEIRVFRNENDVMTLVDDLMYESGKNKGKDIPINNQSGSLFWYKDNLYMGYENSQSGDDEFRVGKLNVDLLGTAKPVMDLVSTPEWEPEFRPTLGKMNKKLIAIYTNHNHQVWVILDILNDDKKRKRMNVNGTNIRSDSQAAFLHIKTDENLIAWGDGSTLKVGILSTNHYEINAVDKTQRIDKGSTPVFIYDKSKVHIVWKNSGELYQAEVIYEKNNVLSDKIELKKIYKLGIPKATAYPLPQKDGTVKFAWKEDDESILKMGDLDHFATVSYLNGEPFLFPGKHKFKLNEIGFGYTTSTNQTAIFDGEMQETIVLKDWSTDEEIIAMYHNSKDYISHQFSNGEPKAEIFESKTIAFHPIHNQPNWEIVVDDGAQYIVYPFQGENEQKENSIRLNSTAVQSLSERLLRGGVQNLLTLEAQYSKEVRFSNMLPVGNVIPAETWPSDEISFKSGPMANYYWELFFHAPFLVAKQLQTELQFQTAKRWYEYIFNPMAIANDNEEAHPDDQFWRFKALQADYNSILNTELENSAAENLISDFNSSEQLQAYHEDPFDPHAIAALRPVAYQKTMVMHYVDNLINWGDSLFRKYDNEDINEAEMLYVMAYDLLGKKPVNISSPPLPDVLDLQDLITSEILPEGVDHELKNVHEFLIEIETNLPEGGSVMLANTPANYIPGSYFGIPENGQFNRYWDTVKERLYDIRNSLNINGQFQRPLAFQSSDATSSLVRQFAMGKQAVSGDTLIRSMEIPYYRFHVVLQKAKELTSTVVQFGNALMNALEKKDQASLNLLYNTNQQHILALSRSVKTDSLKQASATIEALTAGLQNAKNREAYYSGLIADGLSGWEALQVTSQLLGIGTQRSAFATRSAAAPVYLIPTIFGVAVGGSHPGEALSETANTMDSLAQNFHSSSALAGTIAGFKRRSEEWEFQKKLAEEEVLQAGHQLMAAKYQESNAQLEIDILDKNLVQEQKVEQFLRNKFSNEELYDWMTGKLSSLYFQVYQLAMSLALQAQNAWAFEKGISFADESETSAFIQNNGWNNLQHGLMAGEMLQLDLQRMETRYMNQDIRRLEITKTIPLSRLHDDSATPVSAIDELNNKQKVVFKLDQAKFDSDYKDHYCRQIKSVSISIPAVLGPYENIHATLSQLSNTVHLKSGGEEGRVDLRANQKIAISRGMNDNGLFHINFDDPRYLPFEGTGAISVWELSIPGSSNKSLLVDKDKPNGALKLTEVIVEMKYTALS